MSSEGLEATEAEIDEVLQETEGDDGATDQAIID